MVCKRLLSALCLLIILTARVVRGQQSQSKNASEVLAAVAGVGGAAVPTASSGEELRRVLEGAGQSSLVVELQGDISLAGPEWGNAPPINISAGRTVVLRHTLAGRFDAFHIDAGGRLAFQGLVLRGMPGLGPTARFTKEANAADPTGLAVFPSVVCEPDCQIVYRNNFVDFWHQDCSADSMRGIIFRMGIAVGSGNAVGPLNATAYFVAGNTSLPVPLVQNDINNQSTAFLVVQDSVRNCVIDPTAGEVAAAIPPHGNGTAAGDVPVAGGSGSNSLPAWAWALVGLGIAALLLAVLLAALLLRRRRRQNQAALKAADREAPSSPPATPADQVDRANSEDKSLEKAPSGDLGSSPSVMLQQLLHAWRVRIGEVHGLQFLEPLGRGGDATVWKARWKGAIVAVKLLEHSLAGPVMDQIRREAALSTSVSHPNVVSTYKVCTLELADLRQLRLHIDLDAPDDSLSSSGLASGASSGSRRTTLDMGTAATTSRGSLPPSASPHPASASSTPHSTPAASSKAGAAGPAAGAWQDAMAGLGATLIVQEYCDLGSLDGVIQRGSLLWHPESGAPNEAALVRVLIDPALGLEYLHSVDIIHGDVKAANVLMRSAGPARRGHHAKIGDLGVSRMLGHAQTSLQTSATMGTATHMAPELLSTGRLTRAADVYAFGILMWELWARKRCWEGVPLAQLNYRVVAQHERPPLPVDCPPGYLALMQRCWQPEPQDRPSFEAVLQQLRALLPQRPRKVVPPAADSTATPGSA